MTMTTTDDRIAKAYELGCSRGWDHSNFVDAYGKEHEHKGPRYPSHVLPIEYGSAEHWRLTPDDRFAESEIRPRLAAEFKRGWTDGRKRFHQGRYADGEKIED
jgi:hypothetical protein